MRHSGVGKILLSCRSFLFSPVGYLHSRAASEPKSKGLDSRANIPSWECVQPRRQEEGAGKSHSPAPRPPVIVGLFLKRYQSLHKGLGLAGSSSHGASPQSREKETAPSQSQFQGLSRLSLNK